MKHPRREFVVGARPAFAEDRLVIGHDFRFDKELGERRMRNVDGSRREHDFGVTRDIERSLRCGSVGDDDPAHLDVDVGGNCNVRARFDPMIATVKHRAPFGEQGFRSVRMLQCRLEGGRPASRLQRHAGSRTSPSCHRWHPPANG